MVGPLRAHQGRRAGVLTRGNDFDLSHSDMCKSIVQRDL
jgi:hypothetical protein